MSLARTALRLAAIEAMNADPVIAGLVQGRIFDSRIEDFDAGLPVPVIVLYTDQDSGPPWSAQNGGPPFNTTCDLLIEISMRVRVIDDATQEISLSTPETDRELEATLDLLSQKAVEAITIADTPQSRLVRQAVTRRANNYLSVRYASAETGMKFALHIITLSLELKGDDTPANAALRCRGEDAPTPGAFDVLPLPLRSVAEALDPASSGYATCVAIAARLSAQTITEFCAVNLILHPQDFRTQHGALVPLSAPNAPASFAQDIDVNGRDPDPDIGQTEQPQGAHC